MPDNSELNPTVAWFPMIAHKAYKRTYNISAGLNYVSIKDQVVRACALVDSLIASKVLIPGPDEPDTWDLVVIGAGAAGVTAAWRAAEKGMRVIVAEQEKQPFPAQIASTQRIISFSMYDWPEPFSNTERFPSLNNSPVSGNASNEHEFPCFSDQNVPLLASEHAKRWTARLGLNGGTANPSSAKYAIDWRFETIARPQQLQESIFAPDHGSISVSLSRLGISTKIFARNIVAATGIGMEKSVGSYAPRSFWQDDADAPWSRSPLCDGEVIVISGAGDGAIQDALKSIFNTDHGSLIPIAEELLGTKGATGKKQAILAAERHAERQLLWGVDDTSVYEGLQRVYDGIVSAISEARLKKWRKKYLRTLPTIEWLIGPRNVFSKSYPLNRFLGTVLKRSEFNNQITIHQCRLHSVEGPTSGMWKCSTDSALTLYSTYPPLVRHGIEVSDIAYSAEYDRQAIRVALSRAPLPFKPFNF